MNTDPAIENTAPEAKPAASPQIEDDLDFSDVQLTPRQPGYQEIVCEGGCE